MKSMTCNNIPGTTNWHSNCMLTSVPILEQLHDKRKGNIMTTLINNIAVAIQTVSPQLNIGEIMLSADKRSTKEAPIKDEERIRRIVLPSNTWGNLSAMMNDERNQSLTDILKNSLVKLGSDRLRDILAETPMLRQVEVSNFTVSALLKWSEETATSRGGITFTREQAENWYASSVTKTANADKWATAGKNAATITTMHQFVSNRFGALAAKNHGLAKADDATKLMAMIATEDADSSIAVEIIGRLEHINKTLAAKANEATVSMDDL